MQGSWPRNEFHYRISVSDDDKAPVSRKRKFRDDYQMRVTGVRDVFRTCYYCDDRMRPIMDLDFKTTTFSNVEYRRFTVIEDDDIGVVASMITQIGRVVNGGVKFEEVDEMVHRIWCVVDDGFRSGTEKLDLIVTVENQNPLPLEEYESLLWGRGRATSFKLKAKLDMLNLNDGSLLIKFFRSIEQIPQKLII